LIQIIPWSMILVITSRNRVFGAHRLKRCAPLLDSGSVATHTAKHAHHRGPAFQTAMSSRLTSMKGRSFGFVGAIRSLKHERKSFRTLPHSTRPQFDRAQGKSVRTIGLADDTGRRGLGRRSLFLRAFRKAQAGYTCFEVETKHSPRATNPYCDS